MSNTPQWISSDTEKSVIDLTGDRLFPSKSFPQTRRPLYGQHPPLRVRRLESSSSRAVLLSRSTQVIEIDLTGEVSDSEITAQQPSVPSHGQTRIALSNSATDSGQSRQPGGHTADANSNTDTGGSETLPETMMRTIMNKVYKRPYEREEFPTVNHGESPQKKSKTSSRGSVSVRSFGPDSLTRNSSSSRTLKQGTAASSKGRHGAVENPINPLSKNSPSRISIARTSPSAATGAFGARRRDLKADEGLGLKTSRFNRGSQSRGSEVPESDCSSSSENETGSEDGFPRRPFEAMHKRSLSSKAPSSPGKGSQAVGKRTLGNPRQFGVAPQTSPVQQDQRRHQCSADLGLRQKPSLIVLPGRDTQAATMKPSKEVQFSLAGAHKNVFPLSPSQTSTDSMDSTLGELVAPDSQRNIFQTQEHQLPFARPATAGVSLPTLRASKCAPSTGAASRSVRTATAVPGKEGQTSPSSVNTTYPKNAYSTDLSPRTGAQPNGSARQFVPGRRESTRGASPTRPTRPEKSRRFMEHAECQRLAKEADSSSSSLGQDGDGQQGPIQRKNLTLVDQITTRASPSPHSQTKLNTPESMDDTGLKSGPPLGAKTGQQKVADLFTQSTFSNNSAALQKKAVAPASNEALVTERVVAKWVDDYRSDNEYWLRQWLQKARGAAVNYKSTDDEPTDVFSKMTPVEIARAPDRKKATGGFIEFSTDLSNKKGKVKLPKWALPYEKYSIKGDDVPPYSHYVSIREHFLGPNVTTMEHWPYFNDDFEVEKHRGSFEKYYFIGVETRERRLRQLGIAESIASYVDDMLNELKCAWSDVLRFMLEVDPNVGTNPAAQKVLTLRDKVHCTEDEDFVRDSPRWINVLAKLPASNAEQLCRAALLCDCFQRLTSLPLWHVARRSDLVHELLKDKEDSISADQLMCGICMRLSCPYHGELMENLKENDDSTTDSDDDGENAEHKVVESDIIHPKKVNFRIRVQRPVADDEGEDDGNSNLKLDRRCLKYWQTGGRHSLKISPADERPTFYPCHHPGSSCETAKCSCFNSQVPCEKTCGCSAKCERKWQGCNCRNTKQKVCFDDEHCACHNLGRECDPDLCGDCGVRNVLDPVKRDDDQILKYNCHNAGLQRGVCKATLLGDSAIHGLGLYACEEIQKHQFIGEYVGERITKGEADRRGEIGSLQKLSYLFTINSTSEIDSNFFGNKTRYINHSKQHKANVQCYIFFVQTVPRVGMYSRRKIKVGEELFFNYGELFHGLDDSDTEKPVKKSQERRQAKAVLRMRNPQLLDQFDDIEEQIDEQGVRRVRKSLTVSVVSAGKSHVRRQTSKVAGNTIASASVSPRKQVLENFRRGTQRARQIADEDAEMQDVGRALHAEATEDPDEEDDDDDKTDDSDDDDEGDKDHDYDINLYNVEDEGGKDHLEDSRVGPDDSGFRPNRDDANEESGVFGPEGKKAKRTPARRTRRQAQK